MMGFGSDDIAQTDIVLVTPNTAVGLSSRVKRHCAASSILTRCHKSRLRIDDGSKMRFRYSLLYKTCHPSHDFAYTTRVWHIEGVTLKQINMDIG